MESVSGVAQEEVGGQSSGSWWARALLGDPVEAALQAAPTSYEDVHAVVQSILLPPMLPKGLTVHVLQSQNKQFALQHRCVVCEARSRSRAWGRDVAAAIVVAS